ncbi:hypothetical protein BJP36_13695 [Moorena producens JHB]|uniref:Uncharacterized protein n=1 Tax=Moorena producens (strain JHB) TaxID=1454205 RepID=A0A1D9FZK6_MOOP1|nr:hypothetical protein [Moorena producens]AOY80809.1 hypothetical protein BJP36_13695 [Moorena producens JHB]
MILKTSPDRGNYHKNFDMSGSWNSLWFLHEDTRQRFLKEKKVDKHEAVRLVKKAFPEVPYKQFKHVPVEGTKSPYDGNLVYWSKRNSKLYDNATAKAKTHAKPYMWMVRIEVIAW